MNGADRDCDCFRKTMVEDFYEELQRLSPWKHYRIRSIDHSLFGRLILRKTIALAIRSLDLYPTYKDWIHRRSIGDERLNKGRGEFRFPRVG